VAGARTGGTVGAGQISGAERLTFVPRTRGAGNNESFTATAYQRSADGDEAFFTSRLDSLTSKEREQITRLQSRDAEVRAHEQAHIASSGGLNKGGPSFEFARGPDGRQYAVGGNVQIDTSAAATPEQTLVKAQQIRQAALAPANPSGQDRAVAAQAARLAAQAQREIRAQSANTVPLQPVDNGPTTPNGGTAPVDPTAVTPLVTPSAADTPLIDQAHPDASIFDFIPGEFKSHGNGEVKFESADGRIKLKFESEDGKSEFKLEIKGADGTFKLKFENKDGQRELKISFKPFEGTGDEHESHTDDDDAPTITPVAPDATPATGNVGSPPVVTTGGSPKVGPAAPPQPNVTDFALTPAGVDLVV